MSKWRGFRPEPRSQGGEGAQTGVCGSENTSGSQRLEPLGSHRCGWKNWLSLSLCSRLPVTALKVEGFPPSSHLSHPAKLPQSQDKGRLVRTCPAPSQARALGHPRHPGRREAERPCPAPRRPLQQPCLWFRGLRSGHRRACCQRHTGLPPGPRPCILLTGLWNPPRAQLQGSF